MPNIRDDAVMMAAKELLTRYGQGARNAAAERVAELEKSRRWPDHACAVRVLTAVEKLLESRMS